MSETLEAIRPSTFADAARPLALRVAALARQLCDLLVRIAPLGAEDDRRGFLETVARQYAEDGRALHGAGASALIRLTDAFALTAADLDLLVLAGMPEEHEGFCHVLRSLHPRGEPRPTAALAAKLLAESAADRHVLTETLATGALVRSGCLRVIGDGPDPERSLAIADALWPVLRGRDVWPSGLRLLGRDAVPSFDSDWFGRLDVQGAIELLASGTRITLLILADDEDAALDWGVALARAADVVPQTFGWPLTPSRELEQLLSVHTTARGRVPVLRVQAADDPQPAPFLSLTDLSGPAIVCTRAGLAAVRGARPVFPLAVKPLQSIEQRRLWAAVLPELEADAATLAARYRIEPHLAQEVALDVRARAVPVGLQEVADSVRVRSAMPLSSGVALVRPSATWDHLVLHPSRLAQLREAVARLHGQARVLDEWKFLEGRPGRRGVRMLFAGPPGTGKTLSAEVLASALGTDLIVADVSRLVSKWIGETPKNMSRIFDLAERSTAVILFDEADALFSRRTEVTDAHDRYANLETAYLLSRLERFDGLAILATNLRQNIDTAFLRRLEFIVDFDEPAAAERERLWDKHIPSRTLVASDVSYAELAAAYPVTGALIRNAAVAAAFLAAPDNSVITRRHLTLAMRREYEKSGQAFPGDLPSVAYPREH